MSAKRSKRKIAMTITPEEEKAILDALIVNSNKKEVANNLGVDLAVVYKVYDANSKLVLNEREKQRIKNDVPMYINTTSVQDIADKIEEETKQEEKQKPTKVSKKYSKLPAELVKQIYEDAKTGIFNNKQLAEMYGISASTVSLISRGLHATQITATNVGPATSDPKPVETQAEVVHLTDDINIIPMTDEFVRIPVREFIRVGMVSDRHNMPTKEYIFETMESDLMFNYDLQYSIAEKRIKELIRFKGKTQVPENGLMVYVTGLTCALATIIKVCNDLNVSLILLHHHAQDKTYRMQKVIKGSIPMNNVLPEMMKKIDHNSVWTLNCDIDEFVESGGFEILQLTFSKDGDKNIATRDLTLVTDKQIAWRYYISLVENKDPKTNIFFNKISTAEAKYQKIGVISKSSNGML